MKKKRGKANKFKHCHIAPYTITLQMNKKSKTITLIRKFLYLTGLPCSQELPFVCISILLMGLPNALPDIYHLLTSSSDLNVYTVALGNASLIFLYAYISAASITLVKNAKARKAYKYCLYALGIIVNGICQYALCNFHLTISPTWFIMLAETTSNESSEFISQYIFSDSMASTLTFTLMYILTIIVSEKLWHKIKQRQHNTASATKYCFGIAVGTMLLYSISSTAIYWKIYNAPSTDHIRAMHTPKDPISAIYTTFVSLQMMGENVREAIALNKVVYHNGTHIATSDESLNVIVVIGESYIKYHSQLYGYNLETTPNLTREQEAQRLFVFNDVITSSNMTSIALRNILCCNNSSDNESWHNFPSLLTIFKAAGYNVYFWDNQHDFERQDNYSFTLKSFLYAPELRNVSYTQINDIQFQYDGELIEDFTNSIGTPSAGHNLIIFHLIGQHHSADERYPKEFNTFNSDRIQRDAPYLGEKEKAYIASYDNATLYNDHVLHSIIETFRHTNTLMVFFSDHGEEVYDYRHQCARDHGPMSADKLKYQYDVPFFVWCSDIFKSKYPHIINNIKQATNRPLITDNLCHMLFNIASIRTPYYREEFDILSPNYKRNKRTINQFYQYEDIRFSQKGYGICN